MATENKDQEVETASATLADGMHFIGNIEGFRMDLDAEERSFTSCALLSRETLKAQCEQEHRSEQAQENQRRTDEQRAHRCDLIFHKAR